MKGCPSCHARWDEGAARCRRCGLDLTHALAAEQAAERLLVRAIERLAAEDTETACDALARAGRLVRDPLIGHLLAFADARRQREIGGHLEAIARALDRAGISVGPPRG